MNKAERKAIEKLALSAYALHLYEGLNYRGNYTLGEVIRYWRQAKEDVGAIAPQITLTDPNVFRLMDDYKRNVKNLEDSIADMLKNGSIYVADKTNKDDRIEIAAAQLPETFSVRAFPDKVLRVVRAYSYVDDANRVQLVTEIAGKGIHFGKGTLEELRAELITGRAA